MGKFSLTRTLQGLTVINFGMGAFNLFNKIKNRDLQSRIDALLKQREELREKISQLQDVKIETLEHKVLVEQKIENLNCILAKNNEDFTILRDFVNNNSVPLDSNIVKQKIEIAEKSYHSVSEAAADLVKNIKQNFIGGDGFNFVIENLQE